MDPIVIVTRASKTPAASAPVGGELSAAEVDANWNNLKTACEQLDAEKLPASAATPITAALTTLLASDQVVVIRSGVPYLATLAAVQTFVGGAPSATAPAAFTTGQWTLTAGTESATLNITALPSDGGSAITALQYRIGTGSPVTLSGTGTGSRTITGLTGGVAIDVQIRAVNAIGAGAWSDTKSVTPSAAGGGGSGPATWQAVELQAPATLDATTGITAPAPAGTASTDLLVTIIRGNETVDGLVAPAGWTLIGVEDIAFGGLQQTVYWAPGSVTNFNWRTSTGGSSSVVIEVHRISGANLSAPVRAFAYRDSDDWGTGADMPTPSVTAGAGDCIISTYYQPQSDSAVGTPPAGYTQVVNANVPNRKTTLVRSNVSAGPTGEISHAGSAAFQARIGFTLAIAAA